jgi:hypothetical protein
VVTILGYRSGGPGFDSQRYQDFCVVGVDGGQLSLVCIIEELLERNVAAPVWKTEVNGRGGLMSLRCSTIQVTKFDMKFADKWRSLGQYASLAD